MRGKQNSHARTCMSSSTTPDMLLPVSNALTNTIPRPASICGTSRQTTLTLTVTAPSLVTDRAPALTMTWAAVETRESDGGAAGDLKVRTAEPPLPMKATSERGVKKAVALLLLMLLLGSIDGSG